MFFFVVSSIACLSFLQISYTAFYGGGFLLRAPSFWCLAATMRPVFFGLGLQALTLSLYFGSLLLPTIPSAQSITLTFVTITCVIGAYSWNYWAARFAIKLETLAHANKTTNDKRPTIKEAGVNNQTLDEYITTSLQEISEAWAKPLTSSFSSSLNPNRNNDKQSRASKSS